MQTADLTIGEVARQAGIEASAIRFYETVGLLPKPARRGGQRRYTEAILDRLALLERAKQCGFTLEEIRRLFNGLRDGAALSVRWEKLAQMKIEELDRQVERIATMKGFLVEALRCRCVDVEECGRKIRQW